MLVTPHALSGAAIAVLVPNPFLSIPLAIGTHFALDTIPHWQETLYPYKPSRATWIRIPIDLILGSVLVYLIIQAHQNISSIILQTTLAAVFPDIDTVIGYIPQVARLKIFKAYWDWHCKIQRETRSVVGIIPQLALIFICLIIGLF